MAVCCPDLLTSICHCSFDGNSCQVAKDFRFSSAGDSSEVLAMLLATDQERLPDEYGILLINLFQHAKVGPGEIDGIALASVVPPLTATLEQACREYLGRAPLVVGIGTK